MAKKLGFLNRKRSLVVVFVIGLIGISIGIWDWPKHIRDVVWPKRFGVVNQDQIYRSGQLSRLLVERTLRNHKIDVIVDLQGTDPTLKDQVAERRVADNLGIERFNFPLGGDGTGDIVNYAKAIQAIVVSVRDNKRVLVHCAAGSQRTGGVIASYRILVEGVSANVAQAEMEAYNWEPVEDTELTDYLNPRLQQLAELLVEMNVIDKVPDVIPVLNAEHYSPTTRLSQEHGETSRR